jgi:N-glycosylase/DNA lyase
MLTLNCGQAFRWRAIGDGVWRGVVRDKLIELAMDGDDLLWRTFPTHDRALVEDYLRLQDDVTGIYADLSSRDPHLGRLIERFHGIRLLRQDPAETLLSFVCSAANSIPRITAAIEALSILYGDLVCEREGACYYTFPIISRLAGADPDALFSTESLGFRGPNLKSVARQVIDRGEDWLMSLRWASYPEARAQLLSLRGVGLKIADCVCLFSLDKDEAVPVDTHVRQLARRLWMPELTTKTITDSVYRRVTQAFAERYGPLAGWAQQFLYYEDLLRTRELGRGLR